MIASLPSTTPDGSKRVNVKASTNSSSGTPYCRPIEIAIAADEIAEAKKEGTVSKVTLPKYQPLDTVADKEKLTYEITRNKDRAEFEAMTRELLVRTRLTAQQVLRQAGLSWDAVDSVLLVGGSTHMPMTAAMLQDLTGKTPDKSLAVSEVVARGAAIHAGIVVAHETNPQSTLDAGARAIVAGSHVFHAPDYARAIASIRNSVRRPLS